MAMNFQTWGVEWLDSQRKQNLSASVTYRRQGEFEFVADDATPVNMKHSMVTDEVEVEVRWKDFIIPTAYFSNRPFPLGGDKIFIGGDEYEVTGQFSERCWRYHDPEKLAIRIHTIEVNINEL